MRERGRIARAAQLLASCDHALRELERQAKNEGGKAADPMDVILGNEIGRIYRKRNGIQQFDNNTEGFVLDSADDSTGAVSGADALSE